MSANEAVAKLELTKLTDLFAQERFLSVCKDVKQCMWDNSVKCVTDGYSA